MWILIPQIQQEAISTRRHLWNVRTAYPSQAGLVWISQYTFQRGLSKLSSASSPKNVRSCVWVCDLAALRKIPVFAAKSVSWPQEYLPPLWQRKKSCFIVRIILHTHAERSCWLTSLKIKHSAFRAEFGFWASLDSLFHPLNTSKHKAGIG